MVDKRMYQRLLGAALLERQPQERNFVQEEQYSALEHTSTLIMQFPSGLKINYRYCTFLGDDLRIKWDGPMKLYYDNKLTINIVHNPIQHDRTKHTEIDRHFIKEKLEE
ncbi:hypothetical protein CK203_017326 [Vitis vinifera]|uniref:Copia protein n=1 Tax=Vitis vinifera TaxID=29760 RepID=A0A438K036_VITVI|nr:hypothetical protein CK203_017326 [Vitis vinifera]